MEFITPEEVADYVAMELEGRPTGRTSWRRSIAATAGPTYRAGCCAPPPSRAPVPRARDPEPGGRLRDARAPAAHQALVGIAPVRPAAPERSGACPSHGRRAGAEAFARVQRDSGVRSHILSVGSDLTPDGEGCTAAASWSCPADGAIPRRRAPGWVDLRPDQFACGSSGPSNGGQTADRAGRAAESGSDVDGCHRADDPIEPRAVRHWVSGSKTGESGSSARPWSAETAGVERALGASATTFRLMRPTRRRIRRCRSFAMQIGEALPGSRMGT